MVEPPTCRQQHFGYTHFELDDWREAQREAGQTGLVVYTWRTSGYSNWVERGFGVADSLGLLLLPSDSADYVNLPDDEPEFDDYCEA